LKAKARWLLVPLALLLLAPALAAPPSHAQSAKPTARTATGRVWVRFRKNDRGRLQARATALANGKGQTVVSELNAVILQVPAGEEAATAARLGAQADVEYALPIPRAQAQRLPDDTLYNQQWALTKINAPAAWDAVTTADRVTIAVLDTGIDLTHPDLVDRLWTNAGEIPGNGKVDDVHGWHFYQACTQIGGLTECVPAEDNRIQDDNGHGTHVAGIAAAATDNGQGIAGLSWGARIMAIKVLDATGEGDYDDIARGILYATQNGAKIINLSLGGTDAWEPLHEAVIYARQHGVLVVCAAGNTGASDNPSVLYPAAYPEAMAVAATDNTDARAAFSCYGPSISVAAPGYDILSTGLGGRYIRMGGTSMAAPLVAGLASLIFAAHPEYSPGQVQHTIELAAQDTNAASNPGIDPYLGWGRIDAARAVSLSLHTWQLPLTGRTSQPVPPPLNR
jgi:thermitase